MAKLDNTDYKILEILQSDGRISYSDLAEKVSLSRAAVRERVNSMKESGIIRGRKGLREICQFIYGY